MIKYNIFNHVNLPRSSMDLERRSPKAKVTSSTLVGTINFVRTHEGRIFYKIFQSIETNTCICL